MNGRAFSEIKSIKREIGIGVNSADAPEMESFLEKLRSASPLIKIEEDAEITPAPALRIENIYYHGVPKHKEAEAFAEIVKIVGSAYEGAEELPAIEREVEIKIFTTPTCRYCPKAVVAAAKLAKASDKISLHIYDATEFSELADAYEVSSVPKIVINDVVFIEIQTTERKYMELIQKAMEHIEEHQYYSSEHA
jgi:alkyl hydroperoxide reductase subunit AhpF